MKKHPVKFNIENSKIIYKPDDIYFILENAVKSFQTVGNNKKQFYYNIPCAFDIETTSFYIDEFGETIDFKTKLERKQEDINYNPEKVACMYVWQFGINGYVIVGRTWNEFTIMIDRIAEYLHTECDNLHLLIYVHNLSYEFQFICKWFKWYKIFAIEQRKPIYAITDSGIEFRCSYLLSGYSLQNLGYNLQKYKVQKLTGELDYSLMRHSETILTEQEIAYCVNDVLVVMCYIQEKIENEKSIANIPLTNTGYVRRFVRNKCFKFGNGKRNNEYIEKVHELTINNAAEYIMLKRAFQGGFTHANAYHTREICEDVSSVDFTSSYPYVMLAELYPMSKGVYVKPKTKEEFKMYCQNFCCVFDVTFYDLQSKSINEDYISFSKCWGKAEGYTKNVVQNNGRVHAAEKATVTITNVDFNIIRQFYTWNSLQVGNMIVYRKDYLPKEFINAILDLYEKKTTLKGVEGAEVDYMLNKGMLNSCYGMCVTDIVRDENIYDDGWSVECADIEEQIIKYNNSKNRFLFYPWGIFVTAYARYNLFTGIKEMGYDYIYSDTDSVKFFNMEQHADYINAYNATCEVKLHKTATKHNIDYSRFAPKTVKGKECLIGVWDYEGTYSRFKTLGAKRYMTEKDGKISMTVSGVNKHVAIPALMNIYDNDSVFEAFDDGLTIDCYSSGKMIHTYIDDCKTGILTDYTGKVGVYYEKSFVHLENTEYNLGMGEAYKMYLQGLQLDSPKWDRY